MSKFLVDVSELKTRPMGACLGLLMVGLSLVLSGCTDKDREMVNRKGDGREGFKYVPDPRLVDKAGRQEDSSSPRNKQDQGAKPVQPEKRDDRPKSASSAAASKFEYKPDPRLLEQVGIPRSK